MYEKFDEWPQKVKNTAEMSMDWYFYKFQGKHIRMGCLLKMHWTSSLYLPGSNASTEHIFSNTSISPVKSKNIFSITNNMRVIKNSIKLWYARTKCNFDTEFTHVSVSYTHLDVYKRQHQDIEKETVCVNKPSEQEQVFHNGKSVHV